jgi:hypothetical protein
LDFSIVLNKFGIKEVCKVIKFVQHKLTIAQTHYLWVLIALMIII